jgi:hypothetical protein
VAHHIPNASYSSEQWRASPKPQDMGLPPIRIQAVLFLFQLGVLELGQWSILSTCHFTEAHVKRGGGIDSSEFVAPYPFSDYAVIEEVFLHSLGRKISATRLLSIPSIFTFQFQFQFHDLYPRMLQKDR